MDGENGYQGELEPSDHYYTYYLMNQSVLNNARLFAASTDLPLAYDSSD